MMRTMLMLALLGFAAGFSFAPNYHTKPNAFATPSLRPARSPVLGLSMVKISTNDFRTGTTIEMEGNVYKVLEFLHVKPGKGAAFVRTKLKNLTGGGNLEKTFKAGEMVEQAQLDKMEVQFNYMDGDNFVFMDMVTFETEEVPADTIADSKFWMKEGTDVSILKYGDRILDVAVPQTMTLEVAETEPGVKGNTAQGGDKPAMLETGVTIRVPLFITSGEKIRVDTESKKYLSRAKE
eukprot:CAMPEP_0196722564 /NCGR_PEP_ID=MMETSP1091-20130531/4914_1 /TAXON_ID=302021 /ORGANISM="Rhodomonas sp., Strain CCMP768" /LENGTH=235 /DNA_ID=CAMNT_0042064307 /DNA_START=142 /DNA_END=849 /DNA_ORIENTATION=-